MDTLETFFLDLWSNRYAQVGVVLLASLVAAWLVDRVVTRFLARWAKRTRTDLDDRIIELLHRPIVLTVLLAGLGVALTRLNPGEKVLMIVTRILVTAGLFIWSLFALRFSTLLLRTASTHTGRFKAVEDRTFPLFDNVGKVVILAVSVYFLLATWKIDATGWVASAGIAGIAVGFAAKDTLSNLFAGVFIIVDAPYGVGDFILLDSGERGQVVHIGLRSTRLLTRDDVEITIPNAVMGNAKVTNETKGPSPNRRVRIQVTVAYGSDLEKVYRILLGVAAEQSLVIPDPEPRIRFRSFKESGIFIELLCWISEPVFKGRAIDALNSAVYSGFAEEGIEIPYPKRDLYLKSGPSTVDPGAAESA